MPVTVNVDEVGDREREITVNLVERWNIISINVTPPEEMWEREEGPDVILMTDQLRIDEVEHHIVLFKDDQGRFYLPAFGFNNIPYWDLTRGYQIKVDEDLEAVWSGVPIPADTEIPLAEGWNIISYFPTYDLDASSPDFYVLSSIIDNVITAKNAEGRFMLPAFEFSNMPPWRETQGYQVKVNEAVTLNYPGEGEERLSTDYGKEFISASSASSAVNTPSPHNMSVLVVGLNDVSEVRAYTLDGALVGSGSPDAEGRCGLAVWGDDSTTVEVEGLQVGEPFILKFWDADRSLEHDLEIESVLQGEGLTYEANGILALSARVQIAIPSDYFLAEPYPNPFNSMTTISYGLPEAGLVRIAIYDLHGRLLATLTNRELDAGRYSASWDAATTPSGIYLCRLEAGGFAVSRKLMVLR